jgi:LacI family repressor for deo operon, udp, cdd, tsx, nupC, and nupG
MSTPQDRQKGPVNILDVARRAGVSAATVSRTLRGAGHVAPLTRERVLRAAAELAYVPSPAASRLASGRTKTVGLIAPFTTRWFFSEVIHGAERAVRDAGYDLLLYNIGDPAIRRTFFDTMPLRRRVDAVLAVALFFSAAERASMRSLHIPVSTIAGSETGFPRVGIDDEGSAAMAVRHLILLGHRDIAMISGKPDDPIGQVTTAARRAGYLRALREAGLPEPADQVVSEPWGVEGGARAMEQLLARARLPTAVFVESDEMAIGALQTLRRARLDVPGDLSVIGFDDHEMAQANDLTTIAQPAAEQGRLAVRQIFDLLECGPSAAADVVLPTRLVVRGTTGPPRGTRDPARRP